MKELSKQTEELLEKLDNAETDEEIRALGKKLLADDPSSPYGKLAVWETLGDDEYMENLDMLREALDEIRAVIEARSEPAFIEDDRDSQVYCNVMMNLGYALLSEGETEEALAVARELADFDDEGFFPSRTLLYRAMLDLDMYEEILETLEGDPLESVVGEHARAIAMIETKKDAGEIREAVDYAISLSPDAPFFVLGIWEMPEEEDMDEETEDIIHYAAYVTEPWCKNDERLAALSAPTFLFGYITGRLDDEKEIKTLREGYEGAGVLEDVEKLRLSIKAMADAGRDLEEVDAEAIGEMGAIIEKLLG